MSNDELRKFVSCVVLLAITLKLTEHETNIVKYVKELSDKGDLRAINKVYNDGDCHSLGVGLFRHLFGYKYDMAFMNMRAQKLGYEEIEDANG